MACHKCYVLCRNHSDYYDELNAVVVVCCYCHLSNLRIASLTWLCEPFQRSPQSTAFHSLSRSQCVRVSCLSLADGLENIWIPHSVCSTAARFICILSFIKVNGMRNFLAFLLRWTFTISFTLSIIGEEFSSTHTVWVHCQRGNEWTISQSIGNWLVRWSRLSDQTRWTGSNNVLL